MSLDDRDPFVRAVRRQAERACRARELTLWQGLATVGAVGWMVILPAVLGAMAGRWVDANAGTNLFWTISLLALGLALGCGAAWRHVKQDLQA